MAITIKKSAAIDPSDAIRVGSVRTFLDALEKLERSSDASLYYRGHASFTYALKPSIYRDERWVKNEDVMFKELTLAAPTIFHL